MKITAINIYTVKIPVVFGEEKIKHQQSPLVKYIGEDYYLLNDTLGVVYSSNRETLLVKIETDDGVFGWGESLAPTNPEFCAKLISDVFGPLLLGEDPFDNQRLYEKMYNMYRVRGIASGFTMDAMAALDMAFWDIKGKAVNLPVFKLLGGKTGETIPYYLSALVGETDEQRLSYIEDQMKKGMNAFKLHTIGKSWQKHADFLKILREKYDPEQLELMHDGHWRYSISEATLLGTKLDELSISFFECPLCPELLSAHATLAGKIRTPLAVGESMRTCYDFAPWVSSMILGVAQPDIGRTGITEFMNIANLCNTFGVPIAPHLSTHQAVGLAASLNVSFAISNFFKFEYQPVSLEAAQKYADLNFSVNNDGTFSIFDVPGLGMAIDEDRLKQYVSVTCLINDKGTTYGV